MRIDVDKLRQIMKERHLSQAGLARRARLSRPTIAGVLSCRKKRVHDKTLSSIAMALDLTEDALKAGGFRSAYLAAVGKRHEELDFTGLGVLNIGKAMSMDRGFLQLELAPSEACPQESVAMSPSRRPRSRERLSVRAALRTHKKFFVLGDPGSGKTTLLRYLARTYALSRQSEGDWPHEGLTPVFVRLADWAEQLGKDEDVDVADAATESMAGGDDGEILKWLRDEIRTGKPLVLMDGLDEIAEPEQRALLTEKIRSFVEDHRNAYVVITSRVVGFERPSLGIPFEAFQLQTLSDECIEDFTEGWCAFRHGHDRDRECSDCEKGSEKLMHAIMGHPRIRTLARNPMMLTILALLHESGIALPRRRWDLYAKISEAFLFSWEEKKRGALWVAPDRGLALDEREVRWILESIALEMQKRDWTLVPRWWLSQHVNSLLRDELHLEQESRAETTDALIWSLRERAGLLAERGPERFGFSHLAFQEYFAARAVLASEAPIECLRPYVYHARWREVVRLVASELDHRRAPQLLRLLLDDPDPTGRFLQRGLLLTLSCLADGAPIHDQELLNQVFRQTGELGKTQWLGLPLEAMDSLVELRNSRLRDRAEKAAETILRASEEEGDPEDTLIVTWGLATEQIKWDKDGEIEPGERFGAKAKSFPVIVRRGSYRGKPVEIFLVRRPEKLDKKRAKAAFDQLLHDKSDDVRAACANVLRHFSKRANVKKALLHALKADQSASVREAVALALASAASLPGVEQALIKRMESDPDNDVRGACANALEEAGVSNDEVRRKLLQLLRSDKPSAVRSGAARGLEESAKMHSDTREALLGILKDREEDDEVRASCLGLVASLLPSLPDELALASKMVAESDGSKVTLVAARILAQHATSGRVEWAKLPMQEIEETLKSCREPCRHILDALRGLLDAREARRMGISREDRIKRALEKHLDRIHIMFTFGSAARNEQGPESDIDVLVIGEVTLREITPGLRQAEHELGRQINAVVYTREEWRKRLAEKSPFVKDVLHGSKVFIVGGDNELGTMA